MDDHLMNEPIEVISKTYEDLSMEEVMEQDEYEQWMDEMFDEVMSMADPDDGDDDPCHYDDEEDED